MPWREQPADLVFAPPRYPAHDYTGPGEIVTVRLGREVVGYLTRKGWDGVGWLPRPGLTEDADIVRVLVYDILRDAAAEGRPLVEAWAEVLDFTTHDAPVTAPLDGLRGD
ncbi:hypothetical protein CA850_29810 [Micromonospora echinospora]|uniref:Uncharacterized protein n=1 Tax=Micromonospora echinospora TaxID=1877 RepID=A0A1C5AAP0_MICEC|nr:hypothetical protein [Micromonospora echinospora]OZV74776.1 hypothetical protein CA850_29810 [Micromonospora echinospora]SCF42293.1 hypothetical protein GA0070618_6639 [Micromonospora echinospora]